MFDSLKKRIEEVLDPIISDLGVELFELAIHPGKSSISIELIVDKVRGGISLDECIKINKALAEIFESQNIIDENYTLEVNSPGLDRPLKTQKDFNRVVGRKVHFYLAEKIEDKLEHVGEIKEAGEDNVLVKMKDKVIKISLNKINKAVQEI